MIVKIQNLLVLLLLLGVGHSAKAFDLAGQFRNYTCMKNENFQHAIIRAYHSYGAIDIDATENIRQSNIAGLSTDVYMFPCRGKNATFQVNQLIDYLNQMPKAPFASAYEWQTGTIWLDIETNQSSGCSWSLATFDSNCEYTKQLIAAIKARGRAVGIYASAYMWNKIYGSKTACSVFSDYPLWYAHYDGKEDFNDWTTSQFGGWKLPTLKQYAGDAVICGYKLDLSYF